MNPASSHIAPDMLMAYWLRETEASITDGIDAHLMRCDACGEQLDELAALGEGIREAFRAGIVAAAGSAAFLARLSDQGLRIREYRLPHNGSVNCSVAPQDELLVSRLEAPLQGVQRLDAVSRFSLAPDQPKRLEDIPFDPQAGEVLLVQPLAEIRRMPAHTYEVTLLAVEPEGSRELGHYVFHHQPWAGG